MKTTIRGLVHFLAGVAIDGPAHAPRVAASGCPQERSTRVPFLRLVASTAALSVLLPGPVRASCIDYSTYLHWASRICQNDCAWNVAGNAGIAYVTGNSSLSVVSTADPAHPVILATLPMSETPAWIAYSGGYVFLELQSSPPEVSLEVVDVHNPSSPFVVGRFDHVPSGGRLSVADGYAYIYFDQMYIISVSDPAHPRLIGTYTPPGEAEATMQVLNGFGYFAYGSNLSVLDLSNPPAPVLLGTVHFPDTAAGLSVLGSLVYVGASSAGLEVVDVSDPTNPRIIKTVSLDSTVDLTVISGNSLYLSNGAGFLIFDISSPPVPVQVSEHESIVQERGMWADGSALCLGGYFGLDIFDVSNPHNPPMAGVEEAGWGGGPPPDVKSICLQGNFAYTACGGSGLQVIDLTDVQHPTVVGTLPTNGWSRSVQVVGQYAYFCDGGGGLRIIDVSNPAAPTQVGWLSASYDAREVVIEGTYAYLADANGGFKVVDISNPTAPRFVGKYIEGVFVEVWAVNGLIYANDYQDNRCCFLDVSNPAYPQLRGQGWLGIGGASAGDMLYTCGGQTIDGWNVSNPGVPVHAWSDSTYSYANQIALNGQMLYVSDRGQGMDVFSINPGQPAVPIGSLKSDCAVYGASATNDWIALAGSTDGIRIAYVQCPIPSSVSGSGPSPRTSLLAPAPNPTAGPTAFFCDLPVPAAPRLTIQDVSGREVRLLSQPVLPAGRHELLWDGRDASGRSVPAGIYWARLTAGPRTETRRLVIVR